MIKYNWYLSDDQEINLEFTVSKANSYSISFTAKSTDFYDCRSVEYTERPDNISKDSCTDGISDECGGCDCSCKS